MIPVRTALFVLLFVLLTTVPVAAATGDAWVFVFKTGCGDCKQALPIVQAYAANHSEQSIEFVDLSKGANATARFNELKAQYNSSSAHIPVLFAGDRVVMGSVAIGAFLENVSASEQAARNATMLAPLAVATAGFVDGINPCAFAVLALLLGALTVAGTRRRVLTIGAAYIVGVYLCYLAAGFGITAIVGAAGLGTPFKILAGVIALVVGVSVLAAAVLQRRELAPAISGRGRGWIAGWLERAPAAGPMAALAIGIGVGLVELPCTGAIYLGVLGMLAGGALSDAVPLLVLYNLFFVLPLMVIVGAVAFGLPPSTVDQWRTERRRLVLGLSGLLMVVLGIALLAAELA
jgi:cytochrome c biogenesis protein CcdA